MAPFRVRFPTPGRPLKESADLHDLREPPLGLLILLKLTQRKLYTPLKYLLDSLCIYLAPFLHIPWVYPTTTQLPNYPTTRDPTTPQLGTQPYYPGPNSTQLNSTKLNPTPLYPAQPYSILPGTQNSTLPYYPTQPIPLFIVSIAHPFIRLSMYQRTPVST